METQFAVGDLSIKSDKNRFIVFCSDKELDSFDSYNDAAKLVQDIHISKKSSDDPLIGTVKFCPSELGNGNLVVVVASMQDGYLVQIVGSKMRLAIAGEYLSNPPIDGVDVDTKYDVTVENHGSIFLVRPLTDAAKTWIKENVDPEAQYHGDALAVEHKYIQDIVDGMIENGLMVGE
jgi:hypothetical protein